MSLGATITWVKIAILFMDIDRYTKSHSSRWLWIYFRHMDIDDQDYDFITFVLYVQAFTSSMYHDQRLHVEHIFFSWMTIMSYCIQTFVTFQTQNSVPSFIWVYYQRNGINARNPWKPHLDFVHKVTIFSTNQTINLFGPFIE